MPAAGVGWAVLVCVWGAAAAVNVGSQEALQAPNKRLRWSMPEDVYPEPGFQISWKDAASIPNGPNATPEQLRQRQKAINYLAMQRVMARERKDIAAATSKAKDQLGTEKLVTEEEAVKGVKQAVKNAVASIERQAAAAGVTPGSGSDAQAHAAGEDEDDVVWATFDSKPAAHHPPPKLDDCGQVATGAASDALVAKCTGRHKDGQPAGFVL